MEVLIVGAGPAGLTLAVMLERCGIDWELVEVAPRLRSGGYAIDLHANGWNTAERLGILPDLQADAMRLETILHLDADDRPIARQDCRVMMDALDGKLLVIGRDNLVKALAQAVPLGSIIRFGITVTHLVQKDDKVCVTFSDGRQRRFDLVVGADGINSRVRHLVFGPSEDFIRPLGYRVAAWTMPNAKPLPASFVGRTAIGRQAMLYRLGDDRLAVLLCWMAPDGSTAGRRPPRTEVSEAFKDVPAVRELIDDRVNWGEAHVGDVAQVVMPSWRKGSIVLLGDAASCGSFLTGQGTSMAMAGAAVLAGELMGKTIPHALRDFEEQLRPSIELLQKHARLAGTRYVPRSQLQLTLYRWLLPVLISAPFLRRSVRMSQPITLNT